MTQVRTGCCGHTHRNTDATAEPAARFESPPGKQAIRRRWSRALGGAFTMGSPRPARFPDHGEGPARQVTVSGFTIACYAVSNARFGDFVQETHYVTDAERYGWSFVFQGLLPPDLQAAGLQRSTETPWWVAVPRAYWAQPEGPHSSVLERLDHPVVHVSWDDAKTYCHWSGTRLPSEAEWEFAARGGLEQALYPWRDDLLPGGEHRCNIWRGQFAAINTIDDGYLGTAPVHAYPPNGYGLYNIVGTFWEWCGDSFSGLYHAETARHGPLTTPAARRALRGGSFLCHESSCDRSRVAARSSNTFDSSSSNIGFRVAQSPVSATRNEA